MSKKPKIARGMPIGAATMETVKRNAGDHKNKADNGCDDPAGESQEKTEDRPDDDKREQEDRRSLVTESTACFLSAFEKNVQTIFLACNKKAERPGESGRSAFGRTRRSGYLVRPRARVFFRAIALPPTRKTHHPILCSLFLQTIPDYRRRSMQGMLCNGPRECWHGPTGCR